MRFRLGGLAFLTLTATLFPMGCEDGAAQQREEVQAALTSARAKLNKAMLGAIDPPGDQFDSAKSALEAAGRDLTSITGGDPGQQAARAMLAATAQRELGALILRRISDVESQLQTQRSLINAQASAMHALQAVSQGYGSISVSSDREMLGRELQTAQQRLEELSARMAELDGPIAERAGANTTALQEVESLKLEVGNLRQQAEELGYTQGLPKQEQAIATRRRADKIEYDIAQREMDLSYNFQAEHDLAGAQAGFARNRISTMETSQTQLDEFMQSTGSNIAALRSATDELGQQIATALKQINEAMASELTPLYEQAQGALERAATQAQQAAGQGRGDEAGAAKLLRAQVLENQGRLHWNRARGLTDHLAMLRGISAGEASTSIASDIQATEAAHKQAMELATTAYTDAQQMLEQVTMKGDSSALDRFKSEIGESLAMLTGKAVTTPSAGAADAGSDASSAASAGSADGAQAFLERVKSLAAQEQNLMSLSEQLADLTHASTDIGQQSVALGRRFGGIAQSFNETVEMRLGKDGAAQIAQQLPLGAGFAALGGATFGEVVENRAWFNMPLPTGGTKKSWLINVDGQWFIDGDDLDDEDKQNIDVVGKLIPVLQQITEKLRSGEITTADAIMQQLAQGMSVPPAGGS